MSTTVEEIEKVETSESKKTEFLLDSLEIKGYRCFEHLTIEKLGRVNLIVGKNNVGKTALLEALWIYANNGYFEILQKSLTKRNELQPFYNGVGNDILKDRVWEFKNLFSKRKDIRDDDSSSISIRSIHKTDSLIDIHIAWEVLQSDKFSVSNDEINFKKDKPVLVVQNERGATIGRINLLDAIYDTGSSFSYWIQEKRFSNYFLQTSIEENELSFMWDNISLSEKKDLVLVALKIIEEKLQDINFVSEHPKITKRIAKARMQNEYYPIPLKSLGEGMNRLLGIALSLVNCQNGILLIDEIESGLHYSVLPDVWKLIFKTAKDLNVQVFATTHSKDCVEAFAQIANENDEKDDGMLIRLERQGEKIVAKTISEERLAQAVNHDVEVR